MSSSTDPAPVAPAAPPQELRVCLEAQASSADIQWVNSRMAQYNHERSGGLDWMALNLFLRDSTGKLQGGLLGWTLWSWLHIDTLWVEESLRGQGYGLRLIEAAERAGRIRGCTLIEVDTFNFQARGFYEKAGFELFGTLTGVGGGRFERYYLRKEIAPLSGR